MPSDRLLRIEGLSVGYPSKGGTFQAVRAVNLEVRRGETLGLVGESGSGKTTIGLATIGLLPQAARVLEGEVWFDGRAMSGLTTEERRQLRGDRISMVFQNPMSSLNPTLTVGAQIAEVLTSHRDLDAAAVKERSFSLLELVGIPEPRRRLDSYPHELSGGMRQRVMIAMAVALEPELLIADEPTTALDVTIQAQIIWLLEDLRARLGMAIVYITHNLAVAANLCQTIAVCYSGEIVERSPTAALFAAPAHPYTRSLIETVPTGHWRSRRIRPIVGQPPVSVGPRDACAFQARCTWAFDRCVTEAPRLLAVASDHDVRCHGYEGGNSLPAATVARAVVLQDAAGTAATPGPRA